MINCIYKNYSYLNGNEIKSLPESISSLQNLETLSIYRNYITEIPSGIGKLKNLKYLNLNNNAIEKINPEIGNLINLEILDLEKNAIEEINPEIGNLINLEKLSLYNNKITTLPEEFEELIHLKDFYPGISDCDKFPVSLYYAPSLSFRGDHPVINCPKYNDIINPVAFYIYNAYKNKCLRTTGLPDSTLTYGACDNSDNTIWYLPNSHYGYYESKASPGYCLSIYNGTVSLKECSRHTILLRDGNFIKSPSSENQCIGSSKKNSNEISLNECDVNDNQQIWFFNLWDPSNVIEQPETPVDEQPETVTVYLYNAFKNECILSDGTSGRCDFSNEDSLWEIPVSHSGYYHPKANPEKCLSIIDDVVSLSECNEATVLYRDVNFMKSPSSDNQCIGTSENGSNEMSLKECDINDPSQIWYYNVYDPSLVVEETPEVPPPETFVSIYFYSAYYNKCITSDGNTVTTGNCFSNDNAIWEVPDSHSGYYHPKANPEKCLSIVDGVVSISDCNETTVLYREGNFIKSPSYDNQCIGSFENGSNEVTFKQCDTTVPNQIWYFNIW